jgi:hypothetical protein
MRGCKRYIALAMLLHIAASIAVSAQNDTNICEDAALENESAGWPSFTFVQEAANGTFVKNEDGNYTLTLYNVVPYTTYFSDPPEQIAGFTPMERFIAGFNWRCPNAALSLADADENEDTVILAISSPRYDNQTGTLIYTARILEDPRDDRLSYHISRADAGIPEKFGRAELSLGGCGSAASIAVSAQNDTNISENMTLDDETAGWPSFTFVQEAANGTFVKNEDGNYTLTLYNVVPYTTYFSDPPEQIAGFSPMESFLYGFNWNYPNAALSLVDAEEDNDTVILAITSPRYDNQTKTLTYTAKILEDLVDDQFSDRLSYQVSRADAGIPERFGQAKIILGSCGPATVTCGQGRCGYKGEEECGEISCSCCWDGYCEPCGRDCYYQTKCREVHGGVCGHCLSGFTCGWGAPPDGGQIVKQHILKQPPSRTVQGTCSQEQNATASYCTPAE